MPFYDSLYNYKMVLIELLRFVWSKWHQIFAPINPLTYNLIETKSTLYTSHMIITIIICKHRHDESNSSLKIKWCMIKLPKILNNYTMINLHVSKSYPIDQYSQLHLHNQQIRTYVHSTTIHRLLTQPSWPQVQSTNVPSYSLNKIFPSDFSIAT